MSIDDRLVAYAALVRACPHNLLSPRGLEELESRHIAESRAFAADLPGDIDLVDVGPGGGFPGMVIAITRPDIRVTLVEATRKKADFLREAAAELDLDVQVIHGRIEELGRAELEDDFDVATARAVAPLERLIPWVWPALRWSGTLWAIKGERWEEEVDAARPVAEGLGAEFLRTPTFSPGPDPVSPEAPTVVIVGRARASAGA